VDGEKPGDQSHVKWVWTAANGRYLVGSFDGARFTPEPGGPRQVDFGNNYYAVQTYSDVPDGRRIQVGWMRGGRYPRMPFNQQMAFPRELRLKRTDDGHRLFSTPIREIDLLHGKRHDWSDLTLAPGGDPLSGLQGELFDIEAEFEPGEARTFGFEIRGERIAYSPTDRRLTALGSAPLDLKGGALRLRVLADRTSLETFANDGQVALAGCFLPPANNKGLRLFADGGNFRVRSLRVTELKPALPALEPTSNVNQRGGN
jgi:sucrose-6-phosphate hydrolase SacC (GH32 family)